MTLEDFARWYVEFQCRQRELHRWAWSMDEHRHIVGQMWSPAEIEEARLTVESGVTIPPRTYQWRQMPCPVVISDQAPCSEPDIFLLIYRKLIALRTCDTAYQDLRESLSGITDELRGDPTA